MGSEMCIRDSRGAQGLAPELVEEIEQMYGFDKPVHVRFFDMMLDYATFDFGDSFFRDQKVVDLVLEKMPVSISLGIWSTVAIYLSASLLEYAKLSDTAPALIYGAVQL